MEKEEKMKDLKTDHDIFIEKAHKFYKKGDAIFKQMTNFLNETSEYVLKLKKENIEIKSFLQKTMDLHENVDRTLCKVLLAISQNEYLQAWYPDHTKVKKVVNE